MKLDGQHCMLVCMLQATFKQWTKENETERQGTSHNLYKQLRRSVEAANCVALALD